MASPIDVDGLGVLSTTAAVVKQASHVSVDRARVRQVAQDFAAASFQLPTWDAQLHFGNRPPSDIANYVLVLDALNFCFWGEPRWRVLYDGRPIDGYAALTAALQRALDEAVPILDARYLATISFRDLQHIFRGEGRMPILDQRLANLREAGCVLLDKYEGSFARAAQLAARSAVRLVHRIVADFPSFDDVAKYRGAEVRLYKRAQICVADLHGAYGGSGIGKFDDLDQLTAFADYKVPQLLRGLGILDYSPSLASAIDNRRLIPPGSEEEIEIRAATIWAVEYLRQELASLGRSVRAIQLDWYLWQTSQNTNLPPYHLTRTVFY